MTAIEMRAEERGLVDKFDRMFTAAQDPCIASDSKSTRSLMAILECSKSTLHRKRVVRTAFSPSRSQQTMCPRWDFWTRFEVSTWSASGHKQNKQVCLPTGGVEAADRRRDLRGR